VEICSFEGRALVKKQLSRLEAKARLVVTRFSSLTSAMQFSFSLLGGLLALACAFVAFLPISWMLANLIAFFEPLVTMALMVAFAISVIVVAIAWRQAGLYVALLIFLGGWWLASDYLASRLAMSGGPALQTRITPNIARPIAVLGVHAEGDEGHPGWSGLVTTECQKWCVNLLSKGMVGALVLKNNREDGSGLTTYKIATGDACDRPHAATRHLRDSGDKTRCIVAEAQQQMPDGIVVWMRYVDRDECGYLECREAYVQDVRDGKGLNLVFWRSAVWATIARWPTIWTFVDHDRWTNDSGWPNYRYTREVAIGSKFQIQDMLSALLEQRVEG